MGCVAALVVAFRVPVGSLSKGLPLFGAGFLTMCLPVGVLAGVWLERGESSSTRIRSAHLGSIIE